MFVDLFHFIVTEVQEILPRESVESPSLEITQKLSGHGPGQSAQGAVWTR